MFRTKYIWRRMSKVRTAQEFLDAYMDCVLVVLGKRCP